PWSLYEAERRALVRLDPPRFVYDTESGELASHDGPTGVEVDTRGVERARRRIASADEEDLQRQLELVRGCFCVSPSDVQSQPGFEDTTPQPVDDDRLVAEAERLFEELAAAADRDPDGGYHWAGSAAEGSADRYTVRSVGHDLYSGRLGIGLFGAALYQVTGDRRYKQFTLDTVQHTRAAVDPGRRSITPTAVTGEHGGCVGLGSVAYGLGAVGSLLDEPAVVDDAVACTEYVTDEFLATDDTYDVVGGLAGTTLGFAGLYDRRPDDAVLDAARRCGDALLDGRETYDGRQMWDLRVFSDRPLTGFAHGAGGVAFALARLGGLTGADRFHEPVGDLVAYEADAYSESAAGWPDFRKEYPFYPDQWCHGTAGVGLSRLGITDYDDSQQVRVGVRRAVDSYADPELALTDNLCCGTAGQAEFCLEA
ncbi:MAG: Lantibiotic modifying enzyme, partial [halophilic archaeon J07HB67]